MFIQPNCDETDTFADWPHCADCHAPLEPKLVRTDSPAKHGGVNVTLNFELVCPACG